MHYSSVVKDDKGKCGEGGAENGNKTTLHSSNRSEARVLSAANGPSGKRLVASNATSMKQTRPTSVSDADQFRVVKPTSDDNDVGVRWPKSVKRERDEVGSRSPSARRKKRTPRTPSLTAADRMAAVSPPNPHYNGLATSDRTRIDSQGFSEKAPTSVPAAAVGSAGVANKKTYSAGSSWTAAHNTLRDVPSRHFDLAQDDANSEADAKASAIATLPLPRPLSSGTTPPRALLPTAGGLYRTPRLRGQRLQLQGRGGMRSGTSSVVGGPTRSPSPINPRRGAEQLRVFVLTSVSEEERERIKFAIEAIGQRASILDSSPDDLPPVTMTHIVLRGPPRSTKALCGVVAAKWLVQPEYVYASQEAGFWLDEYEEGGFRCFPPPLKCQRFLLTLPDNIVRDKLVQVIEYGGGEVIQKDKSRRGHDQGVVVISSGDELLRFATRQGNL
ncbi:hypothetical protein ERJ75_001320500 [Trypanosoma vivax]|nr:hypothetical protein ERJ75_001320500 [Trypanosoma vivax]